MKQFLPKLIKFKKYSEKSGYLVPFENVKKKIDLGNNCPIKIKRIFFSSAKKGTFRGDHAHKKCSQLLLCVDGSIKVETIFKINKKKTYNISKNKNYALLLPPLVWSRIHFRNKKSLLVVICDYKYDYKREYINSYEEFINISKKNLISMIKSWDYINEYRQLKPKILKSIDNSLNSGFLILGPQLDLFEKKFSSFVGTKFGLGVGNCTDAIFIALKSLNIGKGDEVITVSNTAVPTITAIINSGATPRFVDIDENYLMDCTKITSAINKNTKAIIPVHLYGQTCNMSEILKIKKKYNLKVIEDCAQSTGASHKKKQSGSFGDIGCFSFYPTKILGAYGDAGFLTTNNIKLYNKMRRFRLMGMESSKRSKNKYNKKYFALEHGTNSRLDELQASILNIKINFIKKYINKRRQIAKIYYENLKKTDLILPHTENNNFHVYYQYTVAHKYRDRIIKKLLKKNINLNITYPYPVHTMPPYKKFFNKKRDKLIKTDLASKQIFSLPTYPSIKDDNVEKIIKEIKQLI